MTADLVSTNPAHPDEVVGRVRATDPKTVDAVVAAARDAAAGWAATPAPARAGVLRGVADRFHQALDPLAHLTTREHGKTLGEARAEVQRAIDTLHYNASRALASEGETYAATASGSDLHTLREPVGLVGVITPWNFPVAIPVWKIAPALAHGNAVVWKPAEQTPAVAAMVADILDDTGLPPGLVGILLGGADLGGALVDHPAIDAITFTGSVTVGRTILSRAAPRGVRVQAEMGGHNPALVFDDADLESAAEHVVAGAMLSTGQKCTATRRILVAERIYDGFVESLVQRVEGLVVGDGLEPTTDLGPLIDEQARIAVLGAVVDARTAGLGILAGGTEPRTRLPDEGHFVAPTLLELTDRTQGPRVWREEVFGPVAVVHAVGDDDEAIAVANDTAYGLSAAVHTRDLARARRAVRQLEAGMIAVNGPTTGAELHAPFGGFKGSTVPAPREQGETARDFFTRTKTVSVRDPGS